MGKHRKFSPEFKVQVVLEALQGHKSQAQLAREHQLTDDQITRWRQEFLARAPSVFATGHTRSAEQERIAELERLVGQLSLELNILKKASQLLRSGVTRNGSS